MGLRDKWMAQMSARMPDYGSVLTEALGDDAPCQAHALVVPAAYERNSGSGSDIGSALLKRAVDLASNSIAENKHIGGDDGSIARSLPRVGDMLALALSPTSLSFWSFGITGRELPPQRRIRLDRDVVRGLVGTGKRSQGGAGVARLSFVDGSFFDYRVVMAPAPEFWVEAESLTT
ncbi:hypothetical protein [Nocardioides sp.]|uniref:hypothetical protein n=1 Tax=Nocardioides sp. TaxID=35761 RepID=UPI002CAF915F|nr:hypothetical protein [Nocardioides sp.]HXH80966.1 hypothetical protein [Nocardioides sp.]